MELALRMPAAFAGDLINTLVLRLFITFAVTATILPAAIRVHRDYLAFLALGPGGTPSTVPGYLRIKALGLVALKNPYEPGLRLRGRPEKEGFLRSLAPRKRPRPETKGIAPQRQITQRASKCMYDKLSAAVESLACVDSGLTVATSCFEKHSTGLFSTSPANKTCKGKLGEICHAHPSDGSMHLTLHPADADVVLTAGWGERHPLARGGWFERFVPAGFLMIYAPQDDEDLATVLQIVNAAIWHVCEDRDQARVPQESVVCRGETAASVVPRAELGPKLGSMKPWVVGRSGVKQRFQ